MSDTNNIIFEDRFAVDVSCSSLIFKPQSGADTSQDVDKDGKKFDRVSRITATSLSLNMSLTLDIAVELYPLQAAEKFSLAIARSLVPEELSEAQNGDGESENGDGVKKIKRELWRGGDMGLAGDYDYVMHGKVYKFDDSAQGENQTTAYLSFGGLLMALRGSYRHLAGVVVGENVYLLMRK
ncbi:DNA-directed RNA polymerases I, II, and III subunit RPABC3, partial [Tremellales sp. Uapishka_1]